MKQMINLTSVGNARELGGYAVKDGIIKNGLLLRSAGLYGISPEDIETLRSEYNLGLVADFRMSYEQQEVPDPEIPEAQNRFFPVMELYDFEGFDPKYEAILSDPGSDRLELMKTAAEMGLLDDKLYVDFIFGDRGKQAYRDFFKCLLELNEGRAVLWHCTDGKDRTGIAAMLILVALGADRKTIIDDYLLTNEYNSKKIQMTKAGLEQKHLPQNFLELALFGAGAVYEKYMTNALDAMTERCGSPEGYLSDMIGVGKNECEELRKKFVKR